MKVPLSYAWGALLFNEKVSASGLSAACVVVMGLVAVSMKGRQVGSGVAALPACAVLILNRLDYELLDIGISFMTKTVYQQRFWHFSCFLPLVFSGKVVRSRCCEASISGWDLCAATMCFSLREVIKCVTTCFLQMAAMHTTAIWQISLYMLSLCGVFPGQNIVKCKALHCC